MVSMWMIGALLALAEAQEAPSAVTFRDAPLLEGLDEVELAAVLIDMERRAPGDVWLVSRRHPATAALGVGLPDAVNDLDWTVGRGGEAACGLAVSGFSRYKVVPQGRCPDLQLPERWPAPEADPREVARALPSVSGRRGAGVALLTMGVGYGMMAYPTYRFGEQVSQPCSVGDFGPCLVGGPLRRWDW